MVQEKIPESPGLQGDHQSILKEINPEYSLEGLILKLQYSGHLMRRANSLEKTLFQGKTEGKRRRGWQRIRRLDSVTDSTDINLSNSRKQWRTEEPSMLQSTRSQRIGDDLVTEQQRQTSYIQRNKEKNDKFLWENKANEKIGEHL